jgi:hypothetical protein
MKKHNQEYVIVIIMAIFIEIAFLSSIFARPRYLMCHDSEIKTFGNSNLPSSDSSKVKINFHGSTFIGNTNLLSSRTYLLDSNNLYGLNLLMLPYTNGGLNSYVFFGVKINSPSQHVSNSKHMEWNDL